MSDWSLVLAKEGELIDRAQTGDVDNWPGENQEDVPSKIKV